MEHRKLAYLKGQMTEMLFHEMERFVKAVRVGENDLTLQLCVCALANDESAQAFRAYVDPEANLEGEPFTTIAGLRIYFSFERKSLAKQKSPVFWLKNLDGLEIATSSLDQYMSDISEGQGALICFVASIDAA